MRLSKCYKCGHRFYKEAKEKSDWVKNKMPCPLCGTVFASLPKTERKLMLLQIEYYNKNRDPKILGEIYTILSEYAGSFIKKYYLSALDRSNALEYYSNIAASYIIEEYLKDSDFYIFASFGGFLSLKIKQALYNKYEKLQDDISLNWEFEDNHNENNQFHEDTGLSILDRIEQQENKRNLCNYLTNFIFSIEDYCSSEAEDYIRILAVDLNLKNGEKSADKLFQDISYKRNKNFEIEYTANGDKQVAKYGSYGKFGKEIYLKTLSLLKTELRKIKKTY